MDVFFPFLNIGFSFSNLRVFEKTPQEIDELQSEGTCFAKISASSFKNLPESLSNPAALEILITYIIFKTIFFSSVNQTKVSCNCNTRVILNYWFKVDLSGGFKSLIGTDSPYFEKKFLKTFEIEPVSWVKVLLSSIAFKLECCVAHLGT